MKSLVTALAMGLFATIAPAQEMLDLSSISNYLNGLKTAKSTFSQISDDGSLATGTLYIKRPGKMRFEYDPPNTALVLARANAVVIMDPKSNQPPESYPLKRTPLSIVLGRNIDLDQAGMVAGHVFDGTFTVIRAQDPENREHGWIDLYFSDAPVALRKWVIHDGNGGQVAVVLDGLETGMQLSSELFNEGLGDNR